MTNTESLAYVQIKTDATNQTLCCENANLEESAAFYASFNHRFVFVANTVQENLQNLCEHVYTEV